MASVTLFTFLIIMGVAFGRYGDFTFVTWLGRGDNLIESQKTGNV